MPFNTVRGLASKAGVKHSVLRAIVAHIDSNYRLVRIPKSSPGEFRTLSIPKNALKQIQRTINVEALSRLVTSPASHSYVSGRSIISHAEIHRRARRFIQVDLKDFFPSVGPSTVKEIFLDLGYGADVAETLTVLCCFEGGLPQGAPTSPALSNAALNQLDRRLLDFAALHHLNYSRYADDLVLSGRETNLDLFAGVLGIVEGAGFSVNTNKTRLMLSPSKVILTGISISTGSLKVPKRFKRQLRSDCYKLLAMGSAAFTRDGLFDPFAVERVMGRLMFWVRVEPLASFPAEHIELLKARFLKGRR